MTLAAICSWQGEKKIMPQWNFVAVFDPEAKSLPSLCRQILLCLLNKEGKGGGQGWSPVKSDLQWAGCALTPHFGAICLILPWPAGEVLS